MPEPLPAPLYWHNKEETVGGQLTFERLRDFLYILMRDHVSMSVPESIMWDQVDSYESIYSNTYLIDYVDNLIGRLINPAVPITEWPTMYKGPSGHVSDKYFIDIDGTPVENSPDGEKG
jgi:hypothetical protein